MPNSVTGFFVDATAIDLANNVGVSSIWINVIPDPLTTVTGRVVDDASNPIAGAMVTNNINDLTATSLPDGTFSIDDIPTIQGDIQVRAVAVINERRVGSVSSIISPIPGGLTILGDIIASSTALITEDTTISVGDRFYDSREMVVDGASVTIYGDHTFYSLTLKNSAILTHAATTTTEEYSLVLNISEDLSVDTSSSIDVSEKGYLGGYRSGNSSQYGRTLGNTTTGGSYRYSASSYGGIGGKYSYYHVNSIYGSFYDPNELGSGGGGLHSGSL